MKQPGFVHLRVHSEYSLLDGLVDVKALAKASAKHQMPAVALSDHANLFGLIKFYRAAEAQGIKPLCAADLYVTNPLDLQTPHLITLIVQTIEGYRHLARLISRAYKENQHQGVPHLLPSWLEENSEGLIALSGGREGQIGQLLLGKQPKEAEESLLHWMKLFKDRFYLELTRTGRPGEEAYIQGALQLASKLGCPVVATNDVRFLEPNEYYAHEARVCIHQGRVLDDPRRPKHYTPEQYFKTPEAMAKLFLDIPEAIENSLEIARRCNLSLTLGQNFLPDFPVPEGMTTGDYFAVVSREGLKKRLALRPPIGPFSLEQNTEAYEERLELEIRVINQMDFPGYFLIVADFIQWAKQNKIPVGPGRGSGAGSLVAYALEITDLDPIQFELLFERFLNPERVSMPDFDIDFCMDRRDEVIDYVAQKYGRDRVSQIITYGSMAAKAVVRDVGRVLGHPYGFVDRIAKLIPFELGITLEKALTDSEDLKHLHATNDDARAVIELGKSLEGITRNAGKHAGGVVIAPSNLTDFCPLYCEPGGNNLVTQFDKDDVEAIGLVKFDFLGLRTLTIIDWALETINFVKSIEEAPLVDINLIPLDDPITYKLLRSCKTTAVFQLESRGMKDLIKRLKPDTFEDIIALVALFRPGPLQSGMVDDYINVKHGKQKAEYPHPTLEPILKPTNGVIVYQEQVMKIAQDMAGYTLGGADLLRRAMGKKKPEEMAKQRAIFVEGATGLGIDPKISGYIFDLMEKFAGYGFNKSHSAAYALVSYQTAWLKAHYPSAFMAAVLSSDMDKTDKVVVFIEECRQMKLTLNPPDINRSEYRFTSLNQDTIQYGLGAIKGVGESAINEILNERRKNGAFTNLRDLCLRIDLKKANRRVLESLIKAGALDAIDTNRAWHLSELPEALRWSEQHGTSAQSGQDDLFGLIEPAMASTHSPSTSSMVEPWTEAERLAEEKLTLGLYLTGHPITPYEEDITHFVTDRLGPLSERHDRSQNPAVEFGRKQDIKVTVAGLVVDLRTKQSKSGKRMGFASLDDRTGRMEVAAFSEIYEQYRGLLIKDSLIVVEGSLAYDDFAGQLRLSAQKIMNLDEARMTYAKRLNLKIRGDFLEIEREKSRMIAVRDLITQNLGGTCPVLIEYQNELASGIIKCSDQWLVKPAPSLLLGLQSILGDSAVKIHYR